MGREVLRLRGKVGEARLGEKLEKYHYTLVDSLDALLESFLVPNPEVFKRG